MGLFSGVLWSVFAVALFKAMVIENPLGHFVAGLIACVFFVLASLVSDESSMLYQRYLAPVTTANLVITK